jgi:hypothetical protein
MEDTTHTEGQGSEKEARAKTPVTVETIVEAWATNERTSTAGAIKIGNLIQRYLLQKVAGVTEGKQRRETRANALSEIAIKLEEAGLKVTNLNRVISLAAVAGIYGSSQAKTLTWQALNAFSRTLKRDSRSDKWHIRKGLEDQARRLWEKAVTEQLSGQVLAQTIDRMMGRKKNRPQRDKLQSALERLIKTNSAPALFAKLGAMANRETVLAFTEGVLGSGNQELVALLVEIGSRSTRNAA